MSPDPWTPPTLALPARAGAFWNALVSWLGPALPLRGGAAAVAALAEPPPPAMGARLRLGGGAVVAVPAVFPFAALFGTELAVEDLALLPPALAEALCEGVVTSLAGLLPEPGTGSQPGTGHQPGGLPVVEACGPWPGLAAGDLSSGELHWFRVTVAGLAPEPAVVDLGATLPALAAILGDPASGPLARRGVWPGLAARLTCEVAATLGRVALAPSALRALVPGAVVVLAAGHDVTVARLRHGGRLFEFQRGDGAWICRAATDDARGDAMNPDDAAAPHALADLPVAVDLDLGRVVLPLAEVEAWQPGSVVALDPTLAHEGVEVTLRVNGRAVAAGDLVRLDDRLGVRIARLARA
ncbi:FliM/FliN family flagellar motor switch protein [uncultured Methylobacterium sp.]|uniref:FliM/FliN family flagellar motor switch protein n=1 Tax=uncultured Methylobacterium sp. TaxID=157278 RepID=UPI002620E390|nr:FliM/FliN family flagellar motor switch protein [uncultured Methylobacterium sp.]